LRRRGDLCYFCALIVRHNYSRNCSISPAAFAGALALPAIVSLSTGIGFAVMGAWPVLPFVGLELLALAAAFLCYARRFTR
jgi:uncharacterized membrane protein